MANSNQELTMKFDKSQLKDLLIHQIANHMKQNWSADGVIEFFCDSNYQLINPSQDKGEILSEMIQTHKTALKNEINFVVEN